MQTGSCLTSTVVHTCHATSTEYLYYTLIGHFRALYQIYLSLKVDTGRGGSPNHQQI